MTNEAKPSEVAMRIADRHEPRAHSSLCNYYSSVMETHGCQCERGTVVLARAMDIDTAIADAVRKEAEECALLHEQVCVDDERDPMAVVIEYRDRIRARHTPDSKEQPR